MATYYVDKDAGADGNDGLSAAEAFATIGKANAVAGDGDTVIVAGGVYYENLRIDRNGQTWRAAEGQKPVLDGRWHDGLYDPDAADGGRLNITKHPEGTFVVATKGENIVPALLQVNGDGNTVRGFEIRNVAGRGVAIMGSENVVEDGLIDFCWGQAVLVISQAGLPRNRRNTVRRCEISRAAMGRFTLADRRKWNTNPNKEMMGTSTCVALKATDDATFDQLYVHHCHGEGIVVGSGSNGSRVTRCLVHSIWHMCYYVNAAQNTTIANNVGWSVRNEEFVRGKGDLPEHPSEPFVVNDEIPQADKSGPSRNLLVYGNEFVGGKNCLVVSVKTAGGGFIFTHNTFVGLAGVTKAVCNINDLGAAFVTAQVKQTTNNIFENNAFYAPGDVPALVGTAQRGFKARGNLIYQEGAAPIAGWLKNAPGTILADPLLANPTAEVWDRGGALEQPVDGPNNFDAGNYRLRAGSPAIGAATGEYPFNTLTPPAEAVWPDIGAEKWEPQPPPPDPEPEPNTPPVDWVALAGMVAETLAQVATIGLAAEDAVRGLRALGNQIEEHKAAWRGKE